MHRLRTACTQIDDSPLDGTSRALLNSTAIGPPDGTSQALLNPPGMNVRVLKTTIVDVDSRAVNEVPEEPDPGIVPSHEIGRQAPVETHDHIHLASPETRLNRSLLASSCRLKNTRNSKNRFALLMPRSSNNFFPREARHRPHSRVPIADIARRTLPINHNSKTIPRTKFQMQNSERLLLLLSAKTKMTILKTVSQTNREIGVCSPQDPRQKQFGTQVAPHTLLYAKRPFHPSNPSQPFPNPLLAARVQPLPTL